MPLCQLLFDAFKIKIQVSGFTLRLNANHFGEMIAIPSSLSSFSLQLAFTTEIQHQLILSLLIRNDVELARHCLRVANLCQKFQNTLLVCGGSLTVNKHLFQFTISCFCLYHLTWYKVSRRIFQIGLPFIVILKKLCKTKAIENGLKQTKISYDRLNEEK